MFHLLFVTFAAALATVGARASRDLSTVGTGMLRGVRLTHSESLALSAVGLHLLLIILSVFELYVLIE